MPKKPYTIEEIKRIAVPIAKQYGVKKLALFGSYARGEQSAESDIDFLIDKGRIRGLQFFGFANALEDKFGKSVDLLSYGAIHWFIVDDVMRDEVVLYEQAG